MRNKTQWEEVQRNQTTEVSLILLFQTPNFLHIKAAQNEDTIEKKQTHLCEVYGTDFHQAYTSPGPTSYPRVMQNYFTILQNNLTYPLHQEEVFVLSLNSFYSICIHVQNMPSPAIDTWSPHIQLPQFSTGLPIPPMTDSDHRVEVFH